MSDANAMQHDGEFAGRSHLDALDELVEQTFPNATCFFTHGLELLVQRLGVDRAAMTRVTQGGLETCWWATSPRIDPEHRIHESDEHLCPRVLDHPERILVIKDIQTDAQLKDHVVVQHMGIRTYLGLSLGHHDRVLAVLSLQSLEPRVWMPLEVSLVRAVATLFSQTLEIEILKEELQSTRERLDLTAAMVEDHSLESAATGLPNRRYLEIWMRVHPPLARRLGEPMALAQWRIPDDKEMKGHLREIANSLRGEDILVDLGEDCLLLLPRAEAEGMQILLERIRGILGPIAMGATLWQPQHPVDRDDLFLQQALLRASEALRYSQEAGQNGQGDVQWMLLVAEPEAGTAQS
jgi:hypothetical protein